MNFKSKYAEKLRDPRWQKMRLEVMQRDDFACRNCGDKDSTLNVHHQWYRRGADPWDYEADSLVTLCESCHSTEPESREEAERDLLLILRQRGLTSDDLNTLCEAFISMVPASKSPYRIANLVHHILWFDPAFQLATKSLVDYDRAPDYFIAQRESENTNG